MPDSRAKGQREQIAAARALDPGHRKRLKADIMERKWSRADTDDGGDAATAYAARHGDLNWTVGGRTARLLSPAPRPQPVDLSHSLFRPAPSCPTEEGLTEAEPFETYGLPNRSDIWSTYRRQQAEAAAVQARVAQQAEVAAAAQARVAQQAEAAAAHKRQQQAAEEEATRAAEREKHAAAVAAHAEVLAAWHADTPARLAREAAALADYAVALAEWQAGDAGALAAWQARQTIA